MNCKHYDNDEVMAQLGRQVVDQYIGFSTPTSVGYQRGWADGLRGAASFIIAAIGEYITDDDEDDEDDE